MMEKELKKILVNSFQLESELYDFCVECLNKIYGDNAKTAIYEFQTVVEQREDYGCVQSLEYIDKRVNEHLGFITKAKAIQ